MRAEVPPSTRDPQQIDGYRVLERIAEGGQGVVYLAEAPDGEQVALKLLRPSWLEEPTARERLAKEVAAARTVARFCVAQVLDAKVDRDPPYIVSEYVPGLSLAQHVRTHGPLAGAALDRLAVATATALAAIHRARIVHRDLKPSNVMLGPDGPRVIDFGIARDMSLELTSTGRVVGSPNYMAPEQLAGGSVGPKADVFSWACTVVHAATGRSPFGGDSLPALLYQVVHAEPATAGLPEPLRGLVERCLAKDPELRPTAEQVLLALLGGTAAGVPAAGSDRAPDHEPDRAPDHEPDRAPAEGAPRPGAGVDWPAAARAALAAGAPGSSPGSASPVSSGAESSSVPAGPAQQAQQAQPGQRSWPDWPAASDWPAVPGAAAVPGSAAPAGRAVPAGPVPSPWPAATPWPAVAGPARPQPQPQPQPWPAANAAPGRPPAWPEGSPGPARTGLPARHASPVADAPVRAGASVTRTPAVRAGRVGGSPSARRGAGLVPAVVVLVLLLLVAFIAIVVRPGQGDDDRPTPGRTAGAPSGGGLPTLAAAPPAAKRPGRQLPVVLPADPTAPAVTPTAGARVVPSDVPPDVPPVVPPDVSAGPQPAPGPGVQVVGRVTDPGPAQPSAEPEPTGPRSPRPTGAGSPTPEDLPVTAAANPPPSRPPAVVPGRLAGTWTGRATFVGGSGSFAVTMRLVGGATTGTISSRTFGCAGVLDVVGSPTPERLTLQARVTTDPGDRCAATADVLVERDGGSHVEWTWTDSTSRVATARLRRD